MKQLIYISSILFTSIAISACGQAKKATSANITDNGAADGKMILLKATKSGDPGVAGNPVYKFVTVWKSNEQPSSVFWRGDGSWRSCEIARVHNYRSDKYDIEVLPNTIAVNDTLELFPITGGKYPIPKEIPEAAKNTLFYKTTTGPWIALPVNKIKDAN